MSNYSQALQNLQNIYDEFNAKLALHKEKETVLLQENTELKSFVENLTSENTRLKKEKVNQIISDGKKKKLAQVDPPQTPQPSLASTQQQTPQPSLASTQQQTPPLASTQQQTQPLASTQQQTQPLASTQQQTQPLASPLQSSRQAPASLHSRASDASRASKAKGTIVQELTSNSLEEDVEVLQITLNSGSYYWNQENGDLYPLNDTAGDSIGKLKVVKIRGVPYYIDTIDNNIYEYLKNSEIGSKCGNLVNNKAAFDRKYAQ